MPLYQTRAKTLKEMAEQAAFFFYDAQALPYDAAAVEKFLTPEAREHLAALARNLRPDPRRPKRNPSENRDTARRPRPCHDHRTRLSLPAIQSELLTANSGNDTLITLDFANSF